MEDVYIVGIAGITADGASAGSGKDFVGGVLTNRRLVKWKGEWANLYSLLGQAPPVAEPALPGAVHMNLADPIKEFAAGLLGWTPDDVWGAGKDKPIHKGLQPRTLLQLLGTEGGREFDESIWLDAMERRIQEYRQHLHTTRTGTYVLARPSVWVITDVRFPNEAGWCKEHGEFWVVDAPRKTQLDVDSAAHDSEAWGDILRSLADVVIAPGTKEETTAAVVQLALEEVKP